MSRDLGVCAGLAVMSKEMGLYLQQQPRQMW